MQIVLIFIGLLLVIGSLSQAVIFNNDSIKAQSIKKNIILIILFFVGACLILIGNCVDLNTVYEYEILNEIKYTSNENTAIYELVVVDSNNRIKRLYLTEETYNDKVNKNIIALELKDYKRNQELL